MDIIIILLYVFSFLVIWQFVGYPTLMGIIALKTKPKDKDYSYQPFVSIIVPTYNEEKVIEKRIKNLYELDYPKDKYEIIVVDSSSDKTAEIVERIIEANKTSLPSLKLIREEERKGKASAINLGKKYAKGDIILVTDANSIFDKNVLKEMMPHFKDPKVGAVGGRYVVLNPDYPLTASTQFYWDIEYIMRMGEAALDSACLFHGEINAWRKEIVEADPAMISEDLDMAIQIRKKGYKIVYEPNAVVYEPAPITVEDLIRQRKRTSIGTILCMFKHWKYFLFPRDLYSLLIFPSHKGLTMLSPFIISVIPLLYFFIGNVFVVMTHLILTSLIFCIFLSVLFYLRRKLLATSNNRSKGSFISSIPRLIYYVLLNEYIILLAWKDFILGRYSVLWEKVKSTREFDI